MKYQAFANGECLSSDCVTNEQCRDNSYMDLSLISGVCGIFLSLNPIFSQFSTPAISPSRACSKYVNISSSPPLALSQLPPALGLLQQFPKCRTAHPYHHFPCLQSIRHIAHRQILTFFLRILKGKTDNVNALLNVLSRLPNSQNKNHTPYPGSYDKPCRIGHSLLLQHHLILLPVTHHVLATLAFFQCLKHTEFTSLH